MPRLKRVLKPRGSWVREVIDPQETLPPITLIRTLTPSYVLDGALEFSTYAICYQKSLIGKADIRWNAAERYFGFAWIDIQTPADEPPKGKGLAAYLVAIEAAHAVNKPWAADAEVSPDAKKIWDLFISKGVAEVVTPFEVTHDPRQRENYYVGDVYIPPRR